MSKVALNGPVRPAGARRQPAVAQARQPFTCKGFNWLTARGLGFGVAGSHSKVDGLRCSQRGTCKRPVLYRASLIGGKHRRRAAAAGMQTANTVPGSTIVQIA